jgi:hypothetical protein
LGLQGVQVPLSISISELQHFKLVIGVKYHHVISTHSHARTS